MTRCDKCGFCFGSDELGTVCHCECHDERIQIPITFAMKPEDMKEFIKSLGDGIIRDEKGNEVARLKLQEKKK